MEGSTSKSGNHKLRGSSAKKGSPSSPPLSSAARDRASSLDKDKKAEKSGLKKKKREKKADGDDPAGPLLYFSTMTVPTVNHPELPSQLDKFLVAPGMEVADALVGRLRVEDVSDVCSDLSTIFEVHGQTRRLIQWAVRKELAATGASAEATLFRQTGVATCMVSIECKRKGSEYLVALLRPFVHKICNEAKSMEVDPLRLRASSSSSAEDLESNRRRLVEASQDALELIFASANAFPESLKQTFLIAFNEIQLKLPHMRWTAISNFYFLRFVAPALVSPKASGLYEGNPSPQALRALMLISKTLSNAANGVPFGDKEGYMTIMNDVILDNQPRMRAFLEGLISAAPEDFPDSQAPFPRESDIHMARCRLLAALYSHRTSLLPSLMAVPTPVPGWTPPARMGSLSGSSAAVGRDDSSSSSSSSRKGSSNNSSEFAAVSSSGDDATAAAAAAAASAGANNKCKTTLGEMLAQLLDAYRVHCPDWVSDEDKETKKRVQDELMERFEEGLARTMRPVPPTSLPSDRLYRLLLDVEKQRTKELEEELRIIKLKLHTETQAKRDLQLQILRGNNAPASAGPSAGWVRERQRVAGQFSQMYDMLSTFRNRVSDLEKLVLNDAASDGGSGGLTVPDPSSQLAGSGLVSPRSRANNKGGGGGGGSAKDKSKALKRRSWNLKLGNPLIHNPSSNAS